MILEIRHLQLVDAIARHGTMTRASRELNLTQSAISHQLMGLERRLGIRLFHRLGRRMTLTAPGERLLLASERTLSELHAAEDELLRSAQGRTALLRVSTECYTTYHWMPRIIRTFGERHPGIDLRIVAEATPNPIAALLEGVIDVAVMMRRCGGRHVRNWPLFEDELVVIMAPTHPLAAQAHVDVTDFAHETLFVYGSLEERSSFLGGLLRDAGISPGKVSRIQLTEAIIELVAAGLGVSVLARWAVGPDVERRRIVSRRLTSDGVRRKWHAVSLRGSPATRVVKSFVSILAPGPTVLAPVPARPRRATARAVGNARAVSGL